MREQVAEILKQHGWDGQAWRLGDVSWLAVVKPFDTAVGQRDAVIYLHGERLTAEYTSEGRNVLSTSFADMKQDTIKEQVETFLTDIQKGIDDSFARRLLLQHHVTA